MAFKWLQNLISKKEPTPERRPDIRRKSIFSTTPHPGGQPKEPGVINLDPPKFTAPIHIGGAPNVPGATFDEALKTYGQDAGNLKQAFTMGQGAIPDGLFNWYASQNFIGHQACAIIAQHWLVNKALMIPAKDAVRNGYTIGSVDGEDVDLDVLAQLAKLDKQFKIPTNLIEYATNVRRFGIRFAIFVVESSDKDYYRKPFNIDGVKKGSYKGISQVDPSWVAPILDEESAANPASMAFYEPTWWLVAGQLYHKSHLIVSRYQEVPDILKPSYQYGGLPLTQLLLERVYAAERTANEAPMLAQTKRLNTIFTDVAAVAANPAAFEERLAQFIGFRDNYGLYVAGEEDKIEQIETSLADLDPVIMGQYQLVAAVSEVPATKLMGTSPKGFNATGEFEESAYYDLLENIQTDLTHVVERHYELAGKSLELGDLALEIVWNPVDSPTAKENAEIGLIEAQRDNALMLSGAIDAEDIRNRLIADPRSGFSMLTAFDDMEDEGVDPDLDFGDMDGPGGSAKGAKAPPEEGKTPEAEESEQIEDKDEPPEEEESKAEDHGESNVLGYIRITPEPTTGADLHIWATRAGVKQPSRSSEFHSTLMWSRVDIPNYKTSDATYTLTPTGVGILGDEKPALVVFVESKDLRARVKALEEMGAASDYPEFIPHVALKYNPTPEDVENAKAYFAKNPLPKITMGEEIRQVL